MRITFDPEKDAANMAKHGVSLALAAFLDWDAAIFWQDQRRDYGEVRYVALAQYQQRLYCVAYTERGADRRIISLRKANNREERHYENKTHP
jgi:hypothetical protein